MTAQSARLPSDPARGIDIAALITAFVIPLVGMILGLVSVHEAHVRGRMANGLATAAAWLGGIFTAILAAVIIAATIAAGNAANNLNTVNNQLSSYSQCVDGQLNGTVSPLVDCTTYLGG